MLHTPLGGDSNVLTTSSYLGLIFAVFMVCVMVGSSFFKMLSTNKDDLYKIPLYLHSIAFVAMGSVTLFLESKSVVYISFLLFEVRDNLAVVISIRTCMHVCLVESGFCYYCMNYY